MIAGKVLMDRNAPAALTDTPERGYAEIEGADRALARPRAPALRHHAALRADLAAPRSSRRPAGSGASIPAPMCRPISPRTAPRSPGSPRCFPSATAISTSTTMRACSARAPSSPMPSICARREFCRCHEAGAALSHCPTSNLFLGSGLFRAFDAKRADRPVRLGLGTDVGGGTSLVAIADAERGLQGRGAERHQAHRAAGLLPR